MTLSLFDQQLFEKVVDEKYKDKKEFSRTEVLIILNEMTKAEKYYPKGQILKGAKYKVFKYFVRYCLYRNLANYDTMLLISGGKGTGKSSFSIMLAREWCQLLGISFSAKNHMAYSNQQVQERIDNLPRFSPLVCDEAINFACLDGKTKITTTNGVKNIKDIINENDLEVLSYSTKKVFKKAKKCIYTKKDVVYELETEDGKIIRCTKEHLFKTKNGYTKLSDLKKGDYVATI